VLALRKKKTYLETGVFITVAYTHNEAKQELINKLAEKFDLYAGDITMTFEDRTLEDLFAEGYAKYGIEVEDTEDTESTDEHQCCGGCGGDDD
jgi:hypothetical protein